VRYISKANIEPILRHSGPISQTGIPVIKNGNYRVDSYLLPNGDAPKQFIKIYQYGEARKANIRNWKGYIVKTGHKWYPNESISEHFLTRVGQILGLEMANSKLWIIRGQLRFCSQYFLNQSQRQELVHGANIYAGYLNGDLNLVEEIETQRLSQSLFTLQFTDESVRALFTFQHQEIMECFTKMLLFDILVGNNDRHFYNWGVVRDLAQKESPRFSPIFDSARGLFWNRPDKAMAEIVADKGRLEKLIVRYESESKPKFGIEGKGQINHFDLLDFVSKNSFYTKPESLKQFFSLENLGRILELLETEFKTLFSPARKTAIKTLLTRRIETANKFI